MRAVIFEGLDGAGKTTLFKAFEKDNNHYYACFDRWPSISSYVYDRYMKRFQQNYARLWFMDDLLKHTHEHFGVLVVFVDTDPVICLGRRKDEEEYTFQEYEMQHRLYHAAMVRIMHMNIPVLNVNGEEPIDRLVAQVNTKLNQVAKEDPTKWTTIR